MKVPLWTSSLINLRESIFRGYIENISPLRIGAGKEPPLSSLVDLAIIKIRYGGYEIPYIPGSSLKGLFRSQAGKMATSLGLSVCNGLAKDNCVDVKRVTIRGREYVLRDLIDECMRDRRSSEAMEYFFNNACIICRIFGSIMYRSKVIFSDAYPIDEDGNLLPFKLGSRTGIAIDRRTGAVVRGALYEVEYIEPGCRFKFEVRCHNLPNYALGLLSSIIRMIDSGEIKIGGFTSRGYGSVKIKKLEAFVKSFGPGKENKVLSSLEQNIDEGVDVSDISEFKDGLLYFSENNVWKLIDRLEGVWYGATSRIKSRERKA
ncbi:MAG: CRISPR-associated RAMP protein Csx7 [Candidatus Bathyarchaeia archaeon]